RFSRDWSSDVCSSDLTRSSVRKGEVRIMTTRTTDLTRTAQTRIEKQLLAKLRFRIAVRVVGWKRHQWQQTDLAIVRFDFIVNVRRRPFGGWTRVDSPQF